MKIYKILLAALTFACYAQQRTSDQLQKEIKKKETEILQLLMAKPALAEILDDMKKVSKKLIATPEWRRLHQENETLKQNNDMKEITDPEIQKINAKIDEVNAKFMADIEQQREQIKRETGRDIAFKVRPPQELEDLYKQKEKLLDPQHQQKSLQQELDLLEEKLQLPTIRHQLEQLEQQFETLTDQNQIIKNKISQTMDEREKLLRFLYRQDPDAFYKWRKRYPQFAVNKSMVIEEILLAK